MEVPRPFSTVCSRANVGLDHFAHGVRLHGNDTVVRSPFRHVTSSCSLLSEARSAAKTRMA
jgi:hypothetical protein